MTSRLGTEGHALDSSVSEQREVADFCERGTETPISIKFGGNSWRAEDLLASREIFCYVGIDFLNYIPGFVGGIGGIHCIESQQNF